MALVRISEESVWSGCGAFTKAGIGCGASIKGYQGELLQEKMIFKKFYAYKKPYSYRNDLLSNGHLYISKENVS